MMERLWVRLSWWLPKRLAYWAFIRVAAEASAKPAMADLSLPNLTVIEVLKEETK